jgi:putative FmdB family regulatory protein
MPIYEYACAKCESEFEVEQRITEDPLKSCPKCRSRRIKRLISQTSFTLKGGGWYADGYASKKGGDSGDSKPGDDDSAATSAADGGASSDSGSEKKKKKKKSESASKGKKAVA